MKIVEGSLEIQKKTVELMIRIFCREVHGSQEGLCCECQGLKRYSLTRLDKCKYGNKKPVCKNCKTHCYSPIMKERISEVMRYSGARIIYQHPLYALHYLFKSIKR